MLACSRARSCMIFEARNSSRRWTIVRLSANFEMKIESSIAESPPPTTITSSPLKKAPSQTPQVETPWPPSSISPGTPSRLGSAPIARITVLATYSSSPTQTCWRPPSESSTRVASSLMKRVPKRSAWSRNFVHHLGPHDPLREAGVVLDVGRVLKLAAPLEALDHERLEVGARRVGGGRVAGAGAADDDQVLDLSLVVHSVESLRSNLLLTYFISIGHGPASRGRLGRHARRLSGPRAPSARPCAAAAGRR